MSAHGAVVDSRYRMLFPLTGAVAVGLRPALKTHAPEPERLSVRPELISSEQTISELGVGPRPFGPTGVVERSSPRPGSMSVCSWMTALRFGKTVMVVR